jgi:signal transduction histidine kinase
LIWLAYVAIPFLLIYFSHRRRDLPFPWVFWLFGAFIIGCGMTHLMEVVTSLTPVYRLSGVIKLLTAGVSVATAVALVPLVPKALSLRSPQELEEQIKEREVAETALREANVELSRLYEKTKELDRLKTEFLANVSHELRTPLTLILAPLESLLAGDYGDLRGPQRGNLQTVHNNAVRLLQMVMGLLDFSKLESGKAEAKPEAVEVVALNRGVFNDFQPALAQKQLQGRFEAVPTEAWLQMDRYLYERILFNLLSNAVKFTPAGGTVSVLLRVEGEHLRLSVSDTGPGIAQADLPNLFQKFRQLEGSSTRRFEGTGLGLALVKEFAGLLGGTVAVDSALGKGSTFIVECLAPVCKAAPTPAAMDQQVRKLTQRYELVAPVPGKMAPATPGSPRPRLLIAEDNRELATYIGTLLQEVCQCQIVEDGEAALEQVRQHPLDLILADVMLPRRDGLSLCREVKGDPATARIPVVLLTALTHRKALLKGWEAGADEYLFKPFHPKELVTRVRAILAAAQERKQHEEDQRRIQQELERRVEERTAQLTEANCRKDEFLATLAHELRNPLAPIRNALELLKHADGDLTLMEQARSMMERQLAQMVRLIDDLLDISRITRGKLNLRKERVELAAVVQSAVEASRPLIEAQAHQCTITLPPAPIYLEADPIRLAQVFANLLTNAAKYTEKRGHIWLTAERLGGEVVMSIRDTGIGIAAEHLTHIFEMFSQVAPALERSHGGLGIGLALVRGLVELHGGKVEVRSAGLGQGSEFIVRLPVVDKPVPTRREPNGNGEKSPAGPKCRILVVDDNRDAADSLALMLRLTGHEIEIAYDGLEAVQAAAAFRPDVVVLDIGLPKMNGYEAARHIREQPWGQGMALIALTGWGQEEDKRRALEVGFDHQLTKPVEAVALEKLLALITPLPQRSADQQEVAP